MAYPVRQNADMQIEYAEAETELIAGFGSAQLLKSRDGRFELRGGTDSERQQAQEWLEMFMPHVLDDFGCR